LRWVLLRHQQRDKGPYHEGTGTTDQSFPTPS
jgi:hypothetical protein